MLGMPALSNVRFEIMRSPRSSPRPRILIADDHAEMLEKTREVLADDFEVVAAVSNGQEAVDAASRLHPVAVVLDISMPVLSGFDAARQVLAQAHSPLVVFLTVHDDSACREMAARMGASAWVLKRDLATDLVDVLHAALTTTRTPG